MNKILKYGFVAVIGCGIGTLVMCNNYNKKIKALEEKYTEDIECLKCSLDRYDDILADVEYQRPRYGYED